MLDELTRTARRAAAVGAGAGAALCIVVFVVWLTDDEFGSSAELSSSTRQELIILAVVVALAGVIVAVLLAKQVARLDVERYTAPLEELEERAKQIGRSSEEPMRSGITEIDRVARGMEKSSRKAMKVLASERDFASDASHQLRTPLTALLMRLEEISLTNDLDEAHREANTAIDQVERLTQVVTELLQRTRTSPETDKQDVPLDTTLANLQREWQPAYEAARRSIRVKGERGLMVAMPESALSQILATVVENALHHGGGTVTISARRTGPSGVIEIADQGPGVDPALAPRIFERSVSTGGTGLGLGVARELAHSSGGRLELVNAKPAVFALFVSLQSIR